MYRKMFAVVGMLLFVSGLCVAAQNLLVNPGFEEVSSRQDIDNWSVIGGDVYEAWDKEFHAGSYSMKFWWDGQLAQQVKAVPAAKYELSAWVSNPLSEPFDANGSKFAKLKLEFLDSEMQPVYSASSSKIDKSLEKGKWFQIKIAETAPAGTAFINVVFQMFGGEGGGVILVDDIKLETSDKSKDSKKKSEKKSRRRSK